MPSHPRRVLLIALLASLPAVVIALLLLWRADFTLRLQWTATLFLVGSLLVGLLALHERVVRPLQTLSNVLAALREGDYSLRARGADARDDSLGLVYLEANQLAETLRGQRLGLLEATALVRTVLTEIDAAVFAFDQGGYCAWSIAAVSDSSASPPSGCSVVMRPPSVWATAWRATRPGCWSAPPAGAASGSSGGPASARMGAHISWWC